MNQGTKMDASDIDLSKTTDVLCARCGAPHFMEGIRLKRLSIILSPTGKEEMINVTVLLCMACGHEVGMPLPSEAGRDVQ